MDELVAMIEQLLQLEDSVFNASRELIEKRLLVAQKVKKQFTLLRMLSAKQDTAVWKLFKLQKR